MSDKQMPDDLSKTEAWLRERATGHAPGFDIVVYARPHVWLALADELARLRAALAEAEREAQDNLKGWEDCRIGLNHVIRQQEANSARAESELATSFLEIASKSEQIGKMADRLDRAEADLVAAREMIEKILAIDEYAERWEYLVRPMLSAFLERPRS